MDDANGPNIVADIAHISKVAEGTFICHEDPTCFEQSRALYDMHKHYSAARQYIHPSPKPANQIIHPTLIDCGNGSNELYIQQSTTSSFLNLCARGIDADFFVVYVHRYVHV